MLVLLASARRVLREAAAEAASSVSYALRRSLNAWAPLRRAAVIVAATALGLGAPNAAAQSDDRAGPAILIVNMEQILSESDAAVSILEQANAYRDQVQADLAKTRDALRTEETELTRLRGVLPKAEFDARVAEFERADREFKRALSERGADLNRARRDAREELKQRLQPVLLEIMRERSADVMLDARTIVASSRALDITAEAIERINAVSPRIELTLSP